MSNVILAYVRPWNNLQFNYLAKKVFTDENIVNISEHKNIDKSGLYQNFYEFINSFEINDKKKVIKDFNFSTNEINNIIARCRLLRDINSKQADNLLFAMAYSISKVFSKHKPKAVISLTVDSYIIDLLYIYSQKKNIPFIGIIPSFVNGYFRISSKGEAVLNPSPNYDAVDSIKNKLIQKTYTPIFVLKAISRTKQIILKRWLMNILRVPYFYTKRLFTGDYYNYHYWVSQLISTKFISLIPTFNLGCKDWENSLKLTTKPKIYIPLQMFPECTVDYWCENLDVIKYYQVLEEFISKHHRSFQIIIKEHPGVFGNRPKGFYKKIRNDSRIKIVPTFVPSNELIALIDAVLVWTGTVGFEAALRGKIVFCFSKSYYTYGNNFNQITLNTTTKELLNIINKKSAIEEIDKEEQTRLIKNLCKFLFEGHFINDGSWNPNKSSHREKMDKISNSIRNYINSIKI